MQPSTTVQTTTSTTVITPTLATTTTKQTTSSVTTPTVNPTTIITDQTKSQANNYRRMYSCLAINSILEEVVLMYCRAIFKLTPIFNIIFLSILSIYRSCKRSYGQHRDRKSSLARSPVVSRSKRSWFDPYVYMHNVHFPPINGPNLMRNLPNFYISTVPLTDNYYTSNLLSISMH